MADQQETDKHHQVLQDAQINRALGVFMLCFGLIVLVSVFFTSTLIGKLTNLAAGGIIALIGAVMVYLSRASRHGAQ